MKLTDLEPSFWGADGREGLGLIFRCPAHPDGGGWQGVPFANPLDGGPAHVYDRPRRDGRPYAYWTRIGETMETLTLTPSIDVPEQDASGQRIGSHWHGWITTGEVRTG